MASSLASGLSKLQQINLSTTNEALVSNASLYSSLHYGYTFYFKVGQDIMTFPITPEKLTIKVGSKNEVVTLINEGDINILKSPSLIEVEFDARFPMRKYPYSRNPVNFQKYHDLLKKLKEDKSSFRFIVVRMTPGGKRTWDTNLLVALEDYELNESAEEGDDVIVTFKLKQFKEYGVKVLPKSTKKTTTSTSAKPRSTENKTNTTASQQNQTYTVKKGDCLWNIAKEYYENGAQWKKIYNANKTIIENTAKKYRKGKGSSNGHWIYPGTKLTIPK